MKLAIYDKGGGGFRDAAQAAAIAALGSSAVSDFDPPTTEAVEMLRHFTHIVCHLTSGREDPSWHKLMEGDLSRVKVIIRVSSQGASGMSDSFKAPHRLNNAGPWILHLIERSGEVNQERWGEIFKAIGEWSLATGTLAHEVAVIFDPRPENRLALRLLCEAWLMNDGEKEKKHGNIVIRAPVIPMEWFAPFEEQATGEAAKRIAAFMGRAQEDARLFFEELVVLAQANKDFQGPHLKDSVSNLKAALESASKA